RASPPDVPPPQPGRARATLRVTRGGREPMASEPGSGPLKELATSRARFVSELGERLATLRQGLGRLGPAGEPSPELNAVRRRLHALGAAAEVLHFTAVADALGRAQAELTAATTAPSTGPA